MNVTLFPISNSSELTCLPSVCSWLVGTAAYWFENMVECSVVHVNILHGSRQHYGHKLIWLPYALRGDCYLFVKVQHHTRYANRDVAVVSLTADYFPPEDMSLNPLN